ncbi:hypothetical protein D3C84_485930 [compost metagenome]
MIADHAQLGRVLVHALDYIEQLLLQGGVAYTVGGAHHGDGGGFIVDGHRIQGLAKVS